MKAADGILCLTITRAILRYRLRLKAVRKGYIDKKYRATGERALKCVLDNISGDGTVENVSYGTGMGTDLDHYRSIPLCPMTYGQALAILILMEGLYENA